MPPALALLTPVNMAVLAMRDGIITGTTEPGQTVTVVVTDAATNEVIRTDVVADANGDFAVAYTALPDQTYVVQASATDAAGNTSALTSTFTVDLVAPTVTINAPIADASLNDTTPDVDVASAVDASVEVVIYDDQANEVDRFVLTNDGNGGFTGEGTVVLAEGTYTAEVTSVRPNGLSASDSVDFTVDTTAPEIAITAPGDGMVSNDNSPTISGTAVADSLVTVTITDDAGMTVFTQDVTADANRLWTLDADVLADGDYSVEASTEDAAGNVGTAGPVAFTLDTMAPVVTLTSPTAGQILDTATPTLSGTGERQRHDCHHVESWRCWWNGRRLRLQLHLACKWRWFAACPPDWPCGYPCAPSTLTQRSGGLWTAASNQSQNAS
ncbi:MAG: Ig-like domain-containing protein [bacterium]